MSGQAQSNGRPLPPLRGELQFARRTGRSREKGGSLIIDPLARRYIAIDDVTQTLLALWSGSKTEEELIETAWLKHALVVSEDDITSLKSFLEESRLLADGPAAGWKKLAEVERLSRPSWFSWLIHNYLFIRIPLVRPQKFLQRTLWLAAPFYTRTFAAIAAAFGLLGLYLVSRQWEQFLGTFSNFASLEGVIILGAALIAVKSLHELGHAYTATRYGCEVPVMGVCFMVLVPMLYTDVTDVWRLGSRKKRLAVDGAGVAVELVLACFATCLWGFLPDGAIRAAVFAIATTGWVLSLLLNLNPFMRFDGYYLLADWLDIENLQPRSFALARWHLRETLFGLGTAPPERFSPRTRRGLIFYAYATWIYRFVLFAGIAILVYVMSFKILGIFLFLVEIVYFIAWPMWSELKEWIAMRETILKQRRTVFTCSALAMLGLVLIVPWRTTVAIPAVIEPPQLRDVFPLREGEIVNLNVAAGDAVQKGATIAVLHSMELNQTIERTARQLDVIRLRLLRRPADDRDRAQSLVLEDEQRALEIKLAGYENEKAELQIKAPVAGVVRELNPDLHRGRVLPRGESIAIITFGKGAVVRGYVAEDDLRRVPNGAEGIFVPEDIGESTFNVHVRDIALSATHDIKSAELTSMHGGAIPVRDPQPGDRQQALVPVRAQYLVTAEAVGEGDLAVERRARGTLLLSGEPESLAVRAARQVLSVLIRESGF